MTTFATMNNKAEIIHKIELDLSKLPSSDPIAFGYGIQQGQYHQKTTSKINHGSKHSELSQEYLRGFLLGYKGILVKEGTKIRKGEEQNYWHLNNNILK